jgi:molecular chaperone GrpE
VTDRPDEPTTGPEAYDLPEGEPTAAPSPEGFGDAAGGATGATGEQDDDVVDAEIVDEPADEPTSGEDAEGETK